MATKVDVAEQLSGEAGLLDAGFVTVPEVARFLSVSRATVYALMDQGRIAFCKFGKSRRVPRRALMEYAEKCLIKARA